MKQKLITPPISHCQCGADARCLDWNYNERYQVICDNHHVATGEFNTVHRAIVRWNNAQKSLDTEPITA